MNLPLRSSGRRYGYLRVPRKASDYGMSSIPGLKFAPLPPSDRHLAQFMQAVKDQTTLGACTAFTGTEDREALAAQYENRKVVLSPLFLYRIERQLDGSLNNGDCGSSGQSSCVALQQFGDCLEPEAPYDPNNFEFTPTPIQLTDAVPYKAGAYHSIFTLQDMKTCIISGYRVRVGMNVY